MREFVLNEENLNELIEVLPKEGIVLLKGTLASGKTTLVRAISKFHGVKENVTSPTFSIMQIYNADVKIFHYDIYQNGVSALITNGLFENLFEDGLHLVEWGDDELENLLKKYNLNFTIIKIKIFKDYRKYEVECA